MSKVTVIVDGATYEGRDNPDSTADEDANAFYENIQSMVRFKFELKDGGYVIFGNLIQRAIIIVK